MSPLSHGDLAALCGRAYKELSGVTGELEYLVRTVDKQTFVAIRGTEVGLITEMGILDMIRNVRVLPWFSRPTGWAHGGFLRGALAVSAHLDQLIPPRNAVTIAGHSLGAAVGVLSAQILHHRGRTIDEVVLFGCPRVYPLGRPSIPFPVHNYRLKSDLVCLVPRLYWHAVPLTQIGESGIIPSIADHKIANYEAELRLLETPQPPWLAE